MTTHLQTELLQSQLLQSQVRPAAAGDWHGVLDALTAGFASDPAVRWMYPDPDQYRSHFPRFVQAFGGRALMHGTAWCSDDHAGAALWLPPNVGPDEAALAALLTETVREDDQEAVFGVFEAMGAFHPREPHWYLPLIGVEPFRQGRGHGADLMRPALARCDREGLSAYLEATSARSLPLYERHGFELLGTIQIGSSPPIFPMLRAVR